MTTYKYKGITKDGARVNGVVQSFDEYEAVAKLRQSLAVVTKIEEVKEEQESILSMNIGGPKKIKEKELAIMCSQFQIILTSGLPIVRCIEMVASQAKDKDVHKMLNKVAEDVDGGLSLAQSFENNGPTLPRTFIETIRAGEQSGSLEECFGKLHKYFDKSSKTKAKLASALTYPIIVIVVAIIVFIIIMMVAVPMFTQAFEALDIELPWITKALMAFSGFLLSYWWLILGIIVAFFVAKTIAKRTEKGKIFFDTNKITRTPLHKLHVMSASATFATTMSTMLAAGLSITRSLEITSAVVDNYTFSLAIRGVKQAVEQGRSIGDAMAQCPYFPRMLTEMTGVGERAGNMEETLDVIGDYFNNEVEVTTNRLLSAMEPAITIGLAVITVILLLAVYLPMFTMYGSI